MNSLSNHQGSFAALNSCYSSFLLRSLTMIVASCVKSEYSKTPSGQVMHMQASRKDKAPYLPTPREYDASCIPLI